MEVQIKECDLTKTIVTISCKEVTGTVKRLKKYIEMFDERLRGKYENEYIYICKCNKYCLYGNGRQQNLFVHRR